LNICVAELQYIKVSDEKQETIEEVFQYLVSEEKKLESELKQHIDTQKIDVFKKIFNS